MSITTTDNSMINAIKTAGNYLSHCRRHFVTRSQGPDVWRKQKASTVGPWEPEVV